MREAFVCNQENIEKILLHYNPDVVPKLDFNFCYWLSRKEISKFARSCHYLKELSFTHTKILVKDIAEHSKPKQLAYWCVQHSVVEYLQQFQEHQTDEISSNIFSFLLNHVFCEL
uniref:Uncharacterized protein n=1 Tax=Daphnia galeata TaxID=27404 RepID=A0A8J2RIM3_9CRUS|nr:unnamed protein product [Daphnia galeata]